MKSLNFHYLLSPSFCVSHDYLCWSKRVKKNGVDICTKFSYFHEMFFSWITTTLPSPGVCDKNCWENLRELNFESSITNEGELSSKWSQKPTSFQCFPSADENSSFKRLKASFPDWIEKTYRISFSTCLFIISNEDKFEENKTNPCERQRRLLSDIKRFTRFFFFALNRLFILHWYDTNKNLFIFYITV